MSIKPLLFEFDKANTEGINVSEPHKWNDISSSAKVLSNIKFSDDKEAKNKIEVKSIPSPFARMILFKNAFEDQNFPKEKRDEILEDILDVMELVFIHKTTIFHDKLKILDVDLADALPSTLNSTHKKYIKTLNDFSEHYKISKGDKPLVYNKFSILYIKSDHEDFDNIIAGTSPFTVFFTPEKNVNIPGFFEFGSKLQGITKRKIKTFTERNIYFLKFLKGFINTPLPDSASGFVGAIEDKFKIFEISKLDKIVLQTSQEIKDTTTNEISKVTIISNPPLLYEFMDDVINIDSYYKILPSLNPDEFNLPLVLSKNNTSNVYYNGVPFPNKWDLIFDKAVVEDIDRNYLPGTIKKCPWIASADDFLEKNLIKLPYTLYSEKMYDGANNDKNNFQFLIPLTEKYFRYFKPEDIEKYLTYRSIVSDTNNNDSIEIILKIPICGNRKDGTDFITIKKMYNPSNINYQNFEKDSKTGKIIKKGLYSALWPSISNNEDNSLINRYYVIQYENLNPINDKWKDSKFYNYLNEEDKIILKEIKNTRDFGDNVIKQDRNKSTRIYSLKYSPIFIQMISQNGDKGFFLPKFDDSFKELNSNSQKKMYVGIDFGTSNTVIAFKEEIDGNEIKLLPIMEKNFIKFYGNKVKELGEKQFNTAINMFFVPFKHGIDEKNEFIGLPFSTEVCYLGVLPSLKHPILDCNITFKREIPDDENNYIKTNLKWSSSDIQNKELINLFFKEIKTIVDKQSVERNVPANNIEYRYSYPLSFDNDQKANLKMIFEDFKANTKLDESQCSAKYFTYFEKTIFAISIPYPALTIDIGGGTSDIVGYMSGETMFKCSILFGGQDIFNDLVRDNTINNPIVLSLKNYLLNLAKRDEELGFVYNNSIFDKYKDSHSLFSYIVSKEEFKKAKMHIHETEFYKYFRLIILYFYSSLFYFVALNIKKYFKDNKIKNDKFNKISIGIAGNGSKLLKWITRDDEWDNFVLNNPSYHKITNNIFKLALGITNDNFKISIILSKYPKEEVVRGLLIEDKDSDKISSQETNSLFTGENLSLNADKIELFDDISKISRNNYSKLIVEDSEIVKFNNIFCDNLKENLNNLSKDIQPAYLNNFIKILKDIDVSDISASTNQIIQSYFAMKDEAISEYNNSYFISEVKGVIELIKGKLTEKEFLGDKI